MSTRKKQSGLGVEVVETLKQLSALAEKLTAAGAPTSVSVSLSIGLPTAKVHIGLDHDEEK